MNITIIGGGNIGTQFAVHCASEGHSVIIYTNKFEQFSKELKIIDDESNILLKGCIKKATNNLEEAFGTADVIFITVPAFYMEKIANEIFDYVKSGAYIGLIPGTGGSECAFSKFLKKDCTIFGIQRVPSVARLVKYGNTVHASGYRKELHIGAIPSQNTAKCCKIMSDIFKKICTPLPCYLNVTLTPSNPILHTTRLYSVFKDYKEGKTYKTLPLFYEEWSDEASENLLKCDEELQNICKKLKMFDLSYVKSLKEHYESNTITELTKKMCSIKSLQGLKTPSVLLENGEFIPDLHSRYFTADFPFGLSILIQISKFLDVNVPNMEKVYNWYDEIKQENQIFNFSNYNIFDLKSFIDFYSK